MSTYDTEIEKGRRHASVTGREIERLREDLRLAVLADSQYAKTMEADNERLREVVRQGVTMRTAQRAYFADRSRENLIASKEAERAFDAAARTALGEDK